jgi:hypothetical protein
MIERSHDFDFIDERLLAFVLAESAFFGKGLDCVLLAVLVLDHQVNRSEVALADFLDGLEKFVETTLVDFFAELISPFEELGGDVGVFE